MRIRKIETSLGTILVIIRKVKSNNGDVTYHGTVPYSDIKIGIVTPTESSCVEGVKKSFELQMDFWLKRELSTVQQFDNERD